MICMQSRMIFVDLTVGLRDSHGDKHNLNDFFVQMIALSTDISRHLLYLQSTNRDRPCMQSPWALLRVCYSSCGELYFNFSVTNRRLIFTLVTASRPISQWLHELTIQMILKILPCASLSSDQIRSQFCACYDNSVVAPRPKLRLDLVDIYYMITTWIF